MAQVISYTSSAKNVTADQLSGFFVDWSDPPTPDEHLALLRSSYRVVLARIDGGRIIGYVTAISDGVLNAHIPLLEVLPEFQRLGVGTELMRQILVHLGSFYAIDLICDPVHKAFYERLDLAEATGMIIRRTR